MNQIFTLFLLCALTLTVKAQNPSTIPTTQPFGKIDKEDLELKTCDFEKDANAEILFDKGYVYFDREYNLIFNRHIRIKIFNEKAKHLGDVRVTYYSGNNSQFIGDVQAQTINLNNGNIEITKVDKKAIYTQAVNKVRTALVFSFPNVQPGSVIEYKYTMTSRFLDDFPDWYFQDRYPTRYSEMGTSIPNTLNYSHLVMNTMPLVKNTDDFKAMANVPSLQSEPYMSSAKDNYQRILYQLKLVNAGRFAESFSDTWKKVGEEEVDNQNFGGQFNRKLTGEDVIISKAKSLKTTDDKIAYVFNEVKNTMKWDENYENQTNDGTSEAWDKKTGNSTEINLILYHLLHKSGVKVYPMMVSTRENGKINPAYPNSYQFNSTVAYVPVDSTNYYVLDATSKYNSCREIPRSLLNGFGFYINKDDNKYDVIFLQKMQAARQIVLVNAEIKPDGKMTGTAQLNSSSYSRINAVKRYKTDGEKKYIDYLSDDDNNLKISSVKFENMEVDTLPLVQNIDFSLDLAGSDENYIYVNSNLFTTLHSNPFLSENRATDIDFGFQNNYSINGIYKIPAGYKIDAMPKSASMTMSDNSISFKRIVAEQDGSIVVRYSITYKKSLYFKEDYPEFHDFFKKMHEMLNEVIALKKA